MGSMKRQDSHFSKYSGMYLAVLAACALVTWSGCANSMQSPLYVGAVNSGGSGYTPAGSTGTTTTTTGSGPTSGWNCADSANLFDVKSFENLTVCTNPSSSQAGTQEFLVRGQYSANDATTASGTLCFFPADYVSSTEIYTYPSPGNTGPTYQCVQDTPTSDLTGYSALQTHQTIVSFTSSSMIINAAYVVDAVNVAAMQQCLMDGESLYCPPYAFGQF